MSCRTSLNPKADSRDAIGAAQAGHAHEHGCKTQLAHLALFNEGVSVTILLT